ncbi:hypothetical protein F5B20DRAFT_547799 [Whalleya microplaca]|nr:hypothetical protein F5B20DRAFT_547799 [Whalleya microplaca]
MQKALSLLLEHLNPLGSLHLSGFIDGGTFKTILRRHGGTNLRELRLLPRHIFDSRGPLVDLSEAAIQCLVEQCPNLEQAEFVIRRTRGDHRETGIYRALSRLPQLKHVSLNLWFSMGDIDEDYEEERYHQEPISHLQLRDAFTNSAMDSSLALSIFNLISSGGSLRTLKLRIERSRFPYLDIELRNILTRIGQSWACERDNQGKVSVRPLKNENGWEWKGIEKRCYAVAWDSAWPLSRVNRWENWKSLPLSGVPPPNRVETRRALDRPPTLRACGHIQDHHCSPFRKHHQHQCRQVYD